MRQTLRDRNRLRAGWLGQEVADEFFGLEDTYDEFTLNVLEVNDLEGLSDSERQQRIETLRQQLPEELQQMIRETRAPVESARLEQQWREQGASDQEIHQRREQQFGPEAAERLARMDEQQRVWEQRYQQYREQAQQLLDSGLSDSDRQAELQRLQEALFDRQEQRRVQALDRLQAQP